MVSSPREEPALVPRGLADLLGSAAASPKGLRVRKAGSGPGAALAASSCKREPGPMQAVDGVPVGGRGSSPTLPAPDPMLDQSHCCPSPPAHAHRASRPPICSLPFPPLGLAVVSSAWNSSCPSSLGASVGSSRPLLEGALLLQEAFSVALCPTRQDEVAPGVFAQVFGAALSTLCSSVPCLFPSKASKVGLCLIDLWVPGLSLGLA